MNRFQKSIGMGLAVAWFANTFQGFAASKEVPIKAAVPFFAYVSLGTSTAGDGTVIQMQVPPGQAMPEKTQNIFNYGEIFSGRSS